MLFKPKSGDINAWCDAWLMAGGPHHMGLAYGHVAPALEKVAKLIGIAVMVV
jgi:L-arabinose isomerase